MVSKILYYFSSFFILFFALFLGCFLKYLLFWDIICPKKYCFGFDKEIAVYEDQYTISTARILRSSKTISPLRFLFHMLLVGHFAPVKQI